MSRAKRVKKTKRGSVIGTAVALAVVLFLLPFVMHQVHFGGGETVQEITLPESGRTLKILVNGQVQEMDLNEYIWGVVAAEMPASFEEEALKAQAVAARTYSLSKMEGTNAKHPEADLCTDYTCCQAWISKEKAAENWGANTSSNAAKITQAVAETNNQVALYDGRLIDAVFHSSSSGATEDAVEVWGSSVPYLQSVVSPEGDEVPNYHSEVTYTAQEFRDLFLAAHSDADLSGEPAAWFTEPDRDTRGSVRSLTVGGVTVSGMEARKLFSLRSTAFTVETDGNSVYFAVTGYGHGVGMSQYGANAMAKEGKSYTEILEWYYTGIMVASCPDSIWQQLQSS